MTVVSHIDRKLNALFLFLAVVVFISSANTVQQWNILLGVMLASIFSMGAFILRGLSLDGMFAAIVVGIYAFGLGGWKLALVLLLFFLSSIALSQTAKKANAMKSVRRDGLQVWANGFWIVCFLALSVMLDVPVFLIGALAVIATATADTWATELGSSNPESTYLITTFEQVVPGTDGGISLKGTTAALIASSLMAFVSVYVFSLHFSIFIIIFTTAFLGCLLDSYLGARFQQNNRPVRIPVGKIEVPFSNNVVNLLSTGLGGLLAIILKLFFA